MIRATSLLTRSSRTPQGDVPPPKPGYRTGEVPCHCWCEEGIVHVTLDEVRRGITYSCGLPGCYQPDLGCKSA
jgi:hypothetical protein